MSRYIGIYLFGVPGAIIEPEHAESSCVNTFVWVCVYTHLFISIRDYRLRFGARFRLKILPLDQVVFFEVSR